MMTNDDVEAALRELLDDFAAREQVDIPTAAHMFAVVVLMHGFTEDVQLLSRLRLLADEALSASGVEVRPARFLRGLYDTAIFTRLPAGRASFAAVVDSPVGVRLDTRH